jgi:hypothetical protein
MSRHAIMAPGMTQEAAEILTRTFAPRAGAQLVSVLSDERNRTLTLGFRVHGEVATCVIGLIPVRSRVN